MKKILTISIVLALALSLFFISTSAADKLVCWDLSEYGQVVHAFGASPETAPERDGVIGDNEYGANAFVFTEPYKYNSTIDEGHFEAANVEYVKIYGDADDDYLYLAFETKHSSAYINFSYNLFMGFNMLGTPDSAQDRMEMTITSTVYGAWLGTFTDGSYTGKPTPNADDLAELGKEAEPTGKSTATFDGKTTTVVEIRLSKAKLASLFGYDEIGDVAYLCFQQNLRFGEETVNRKAYYGQISDLTSASPVNIALQLAYPASYPYPEYKNVVTKQRTEKLSTRLFFHYLSGRGCRKTGHPDRIPLILARFKGVPASRHPE